MRHIYAAIYVSYMALIWNISGTCMSDICRHMWFLYVTCMCKYMSLMRHIICILYYVAICMDKSHDLVKIECELAIQ